MTDVWDHWRRSLANPGSIGSKDLPIHPDDPQIGFYRYYSKRLDRWIPVAFFVSDDSDEILCCLVDGQPVEPMRMGDVWHRCCRHPIAWKTYGAAVGGEGFADEPPAVGHNLAADLKEQLQFERDEAVELANVLLDKELDQDIADQIAILSKRLSTIRQRADDEHTREKRPHLEAGRAIDDRWRPLREGVTETVSQLKRHLQPWLDGHEGAAGRTGAKVSLRTFIVGEITNIDTFFTFVKDLPEVREVLQKVANKLAKGQIPTPGMEIVEERRAI